MNGAFYVGATGLRADQRALDLIANNIANLNTAAFKRSELRFSTLVDMPDVAADGSVSSVAASPMGVSAREVMTVMEQGELRATGKPTDLAIRGDGFIELLGPDGQVRLWRGGALKVDDDGNLAAENGLPLKASISVPASASNMTIAADGTVSAQLDGDAAAREIGRIDLVMVRDPATLSAAGDGVYLVGDESALITVRPQEEGAGALVQGSVESSNVNMSDEMVNLLLLQRAYAANAQVLQAGDQLMSIANGLRR